MSYVELDHLPADNMVVFKNVVYRNPIDNTETSADVEVIESNVDMVATPAGADYSLCHLKSGRVLQVSHAASDTTAAAAEASDAPDSSAASGSAA